MIDIYTNPFGWTDPKTRH